MATNYLAIADALDLTDQQIVTLARNSLEACFAPLDQRERWIRDLERLTTSG